MDETLPAVPAPQPTTLEVIERAQIDTAMAAARRWPRSLATFRNTAASMATLTQRAAAECIYSMPRGDKMIEGPSIRFAEILSSAWGHCRIGARVISIEEQWLVAQGVFFDLQANHLETSEVRRRITDRHGRRYNDDMIVVTANAACAIARRNAILSGIPRALWSDVYERVRATVAGSANTLEERRKNAFEAFKNIGLSAKEVCAIIGVGGPADIQLDHLVTMAGLMTAIQDGDVTVAQLRERLKPAPVEEPKRVEQQAPAAPAVQAQAAQQPQQEDEPQQEPQGQIELAEMLRAKSKRR